MELEAFKTIWQQQNERAALQPSGEKLLALLQKRSGGPIARMRRNLRVEVILMLVAYIPCILFYWLAFSGRMAGVAWLFVVILVFFIVYYLRKNALLKKMQCVSCEVRSNLAGQLDSLRRYIRFYFWSSTLVVPVTIILAFAIVLQGRAAAFPAFPRFREMSLLLVLIVTFTAGIYFFNRWHIHRLYGRHVRKLQELLREMDEAS